MAQTKAGAIKTSARKAGVSVARYIERYESGEKWCYACKSWHYLAAFGKDTTRYDGKSHLCLSARRSRAKALYQPKPPVKKGRVYVVFRDGDRKQARRRVNYLVQEGLIPPPSSLPCSDCGQWWKKGLPRHQYDHLGYAAAHHEDVDVVCPSCHASREVERGLFHDRQRDDEGRFSNGS